MPMALRANSMVATFELKSHMPWCTRSLEVKMGLSFALGEVNIVAYLISNGQSTARMTYGGLEHFLRRLARTNRSGFVSADVEWAAKIQKASWEAVQKLRYDRSVSENDYVENEMAREVLGPLSATFSQYDLYILPVGTYEHQEVLDRFAQQTATLPGHGILVLMPDYYGDHQNLKALDPDDAAGVVLKRRDLWPGAIFRTRTGASNFLTLDESYNRLREVVEAISANDRDGVAREDGLRRLSALIARPRHDDKVDPQRRLVHLSDLHFGTDRAAETQVILQSAIQRRNQSVDQVVITGDLFDQPRKRHAQQFSNFRQQLQIISGGKKPIIVPGNHDQRIFGNDFLGLADACGTSQIWRGSLSLLTTRARSPSYALTRRDRRILAPGTSRYLTVIARRHSVGCGQCERRI